MVKRMIHHNIGPAAQLSEEQLVSMTVTMFLLQIEDMACIEKAVDNMHTHHRE